MSEPTWVPYDEVLLMHADQIERFTGASGLRDEVLLRSALARPENVLAYEPGASLPRLAASYAYGIARNHAFVDGNKRIAWAVAHVFLIINGQEVDATNRDATRMVRMLAEGATDESEFAAWVDHNMVPVVEC